ncbi:MAG: outer membrane protein assembly factor BamE, partial [Pseudomonadota bacterium]
MKSVQTVVAALPILALLGGCASEMRTHGFLPVAERLAQVEAGVDTRGSVQRKIGRPSTNATFDDSTWYYVSSVVEHNSFRAPKVVERTVLEVVFDDVGLVTELNRYGLEDGKVIDLETRTTPTYGRQLTILEQV